MELSSLLHQLQLSSSSSSSSSSPEKPLPSHPRPPITEVLPQLQEKLIGSYKKASDCETTALIGQIEQLFQAADPHWLFSLDSTNQSAGLAAAYGGLAAALIGRAALPLCEPDSGPPPARHYQEVPNRARSVCSALNALLDRLGDWEREGDQTLGSARRSLLRSVAPPCWVLAVTHLQVEAWTSSASRQAAARLQGALLRAGGWRDPAHFLMGDEREEEEEEEEEGGRKSRGMLGEILDVLQPELSKDRWQQCEAVKFVFSWSLLQVTRPSLSPLLPRLLPPSLLLSDHYRPENCMLGVRCLHHIVVNTVVLSCLLDLLLVLEKPPSSLASPPRRPGRHDDVLRLLLTHMEAEHKVVLRRVYASALPQYIERMGIAVCRHLRRVERVVLGYLEVRDPPEERSRLAMLKVLEETLKNAWPRMDSRVCVLLRCLLRLLLDVSSDSELCDSVRQQLMNRTVCCIKLLDSCSHTVQPLLQQVDSSCVSPAVLSCLATVTTATQR
uniref:TELO2-interacting protein 2 n=1 Tax=Centroberyx gerrardi TaxID=166262 RepID=UPI003AAB848C